MATFHVRSNSFPSKVHPFVPEIKEQLNRINSSKAASSSSSEIYHKLCALQDLHDSIDKLLTQKAFANEENKKCIDELLDGSLRLLDFCSVAKDVLTQTKESAQELLSSIRRKIGGQETEVKKYLASRKTVKKVIKKAALENLKRIQKKNLTSRCIEDPEVSAPFTMLREVEAVTISVFESLLSLILGQAKRSGWSLVSKAMNQKSAALEQEEEMGNKFEKVDAKLQRTRKFENVQENLKDLEMCVQDLEESIECLNRRLIKTRVSLLNILNH